MLGATALTAYSVAVENRTTLRFASCSLRALSSSLLAMIANSVFFFRNLFTFSSVSGELLFLCKREWGWGGGVVERGQRGQWGNSCSDRAHANGFRPLPST